MPCMCGDTMCPSCGPAQGFDPAFELVTEWIFSDVLADLPPGIDREWLAEELAARFGDCGADLCAAMVAEAKRAERAESAR